MSGVPPHFRTGATPPVSNVLRAAAVVAFVVVASVVWVVYGTVERAQDSNQGVVHTQEVLTAIETVLSTLVEAESAARSDLSAVGYLALNRSIAPNARSTPTSTASPR